MEELIEAIRKVRINHTKVLERKLNEADTQMGYSRAGSFFGTCIN